VRVRFGEAGIQRRGKGALLGQLTNAVDVWQALSTLCGMAKAKYCLLTGLHRRE
jgi:hypothetical protein